MSDPYQVFEHLVEMCKFQRDKALLAVREAQVRAEVWTDAADEAIKHLNDFEKRNPRIPATPDEGNAR
jgi:hypothetical protein